MRRYDVDTIRVVALFLLIVYHAAIAFEPFAPLLVFIGSKHELGVVWDLLQVLNIWRIPILFMVSGMGLYFAMRRRSIGRLLGNRAMRIMVPYVFGFLFINWSFFYTFQIFYNEPVAYIPNGLHLWFLFNIFAYVLVILPLLVWYRQALGNSLVRTVKTLLAKIVSKPLGVLLVLGLPLVLEVALIVPDSYANFAGLGLHGFLVGLICFLMGFVFVSMRDTFWGAVKRIKFISLATASALYILRATTVEFDFADLGGLWSFRELPMGHLISTGLLALEATNWMLAAFGFAATYLNRSSKTLRYLSLAVFPVYIFHLPLQNFFAGLIFPINLPGVVEFPTLILTTLVTSFILFELVRRIPYLRLVFGLKP